jgi:prophage regulatory protein
MTESTSKNIQNMSAKTLGQVAVLSTRTIWRLRSAGKLPKPIRIGGAIRWRASDIELWLENGCPDQKTFEQIKGVQK